MPVSSVCQRLAALAAALLIAACAHTPRPGDSPAWNVPPTSVFLAELPPPPKPESEAQKLDVATVLGLQARATPARIARAEWTYDLTVFTFAEAVGPDFTAKNYPLTAELFLKLNDLVRDVNDPLKDHYRRPHPFQADRRVRRLVVAPPGYSYPSYHSARCEVFRHTLALLDPKRAGTFHRIAREVETDRVFAGEHFPTDIEAGCAEGRLIFAALEKDASFRSAVARVKAAEWTPPPR